MHDHEREEEMFSDLAQAIYADDLAKAKDVLALMHNAGGESRAHAIRRARQTVNPLPQSEAAKPLVLPQFGKSPAEVFGDGFSNPRLGKRAG